MFDDESKGLVREPFVSGMTEIIDELVKPISGAQTGFNLIFSHEDFPGSQIKLEWIRKEFGGNWYRTPTGEQGWLCPALFKYFHAAPKSIYARAEARRPNGPLKLR